MDFVQREFRNTDFDVLWRIDQQCFPPGIAYSKAELTAFVTAPGVFTLVAETATQLPDSGHEPPEGKRFIVGFIVAEASRRGIGHIITIDVLAGGRRGGVGSSLLAAAEQRLARAQCDRVRLEAAVDNAAAIEFYKRHGYQVVKTIEGYYSNGANAFVLMKVL